MTIDSQKPSCKKAAQPAFLACPVCQGLLKRSWNRPTDRVVNRFLRVQRYRCNGQKCQWQGLLHITIGASGNLGNTQAGAPMVFGSTITGIVGAAVRRWLFPAIGR